MRETDVLEELRWGSEGWWSRGENGVLNELVKEVKTWLSCLLPTKRGGGEWLEMVVELGRERTSY